MALWGSLLDHRGALRVLPTTAFATGMAAYTVDEVQCSIGYFYAVQGIAAPAVVGR